MGGEGAARGAKQTTAPSVPRAPIADWLAGRRRSHPRDAIGGDDGRGRDRRPFTPSMKERSGSHGPKKRRGPKKRHGPESGPETRRCGYERSVAALTPSPSRCHAGGRFAVLPSRAGGAFGMRGSAGRGGKKGAPLPHCPTAGPCGGLGFGLLSFPPPPPTVRLFASPQCRAVRGCPAVPGLHGVGGRCDPGRSPIALNPHPSGSGSPYRCRAAAPQVPCEAWGRSKGWERSHRTQGCLH